MKQCPLKCRIWLSEHKRVDHSAFFSYSAAFLATNASNLAFFNFHLTSLRWWSPNYCISTNRLWQSESISVMNNFLFWVGKAISKFADSMQCTSFKSLVRWHQTKFEHRPVSGIYFCGSLGIFFKSSFASFPKPLAIQRKNILLTVHLPPSTLCQAMFKRMQNKMLDDNSIDSDLNLRRWKSCAVIKVLQKFLESAAGY